VPGAKAADAVDDLPGLQFDVERFGERRRALGPERPVPRWSMKTRSRRALSGASNGCSAPATERALWPGPPAKTKTGSGSLSRATAGWTAKWMVTLRPPRVSGFSVTSIWPQRISRAMPLI
jgi:hypothetical protein